MVSPYRSIEIDFRYGWPLLPADHIPDRLQTGVRRQRDKDDV
jgi:hypothetical protein